MAIWAIRDIAGLISAWSLMRRLPGDTQPLSGIPGGSPDVDLGSYHQSSLNIVISGNKLVDLIVSLSCSVVLHYCMIKPLSLSGDPLSIPDRRTDKMLDNIIA